MKTFIVIIIILASATIYSFFDQYLKDGDFSRYFSLQANVSQSAGSAESPESSEAPKTSGNSGNSNSVEPQGSPTPEPQVNMSVPEIRPVVETISPYYGRVKILRPQPAGYYNPSLIKLTIRPNYGEHINITGWKIKTRQGEFTIPGGIEKYQSHVGLRNIIIKEYNTIYLIGMENPLGRDKSFRANKCFGYIENYHTFHPRLYTYCPKPKLEDVSHLNPPCQEFILRLSSCEIPNYSNNPQISGDSQCTAYIRENFSYSKCFNNYCNDQNFLTNYWYIYTQSDIVEPLHDTIYLYDQNGLLVDTYLY